MNYTPYPIRKWKRMNFDEEKLINLEDRKRAEIETDRDMLKPVQQLVCDVHEETHNSKRTEIQNLAAAQKRMVSMMARLSLSNDRLTKQILCLTWFIAIMTLVLILLEIY